MIEEGYSWPPLHDAIFAGHLDVAYLLLERGADVNAQVGPEPHVMWPVRLMTNAGSNA